MNFQIFEFFMDGVLAINKDGLVVYCNQKMAELIGASSLRIVNRANLVDLISTKNSKLDLNSFDVEYDAVQSQMVEFKTKYGVSGTGLLSLIPMKKSDNILGLVYLKDLTHEVHLNTKYKLEMASKDKKILEMHILLQMLSNSRFNKEPKVLLREFALNLIAHFDLPWCLLQDVKSTNLYMVEHQRSEKGQLPYEVKALSQVLPSLGPSVEVLNGESESVSILKMVQPYFHDFFVLRLNAHDAPHSNLVFPLQAGRSLNEAEIDLFHALLDQLSIALENAELQALAVTDELTQVFNVRYFKANLIEQLRLAKKEHAAFGIIMLDVDHFKSINDTYGHLGGDEVLKKIGSILKEFCRSGDLPARYGGEEFVILLPQTSEADCVKAADRLRNRIANSTVSFQGQKIQFTASFGIAGYLNGAMTADELVDRADKALYESKEQGRNRVTVARDSQKKAA